MNCDWVKTNGALYLYDELPDDARHEFEQHLQKCSECTEELNALRGFHLAMSTAAPIADPSPNLLASSRMKLQEALETEQQGSRWSRLTFDLAGWMHQLRLSPALSAILLMLGFAGGALATFSTQHKAPQENPVLPTSIDSASIASIKGVTQEPGSNSVKINYDRLISDTETGSVTDPKIQRLLLFAARSNYNTGVRLDSIDVLTQNPEDARIREALIFSLRYDKNAGVRLKALEGLKPYVKSDIRVRDVMLEALMRDSNPGVRTEAIRSLQPVTADSSVRETLAVLAGQDKNKYIRDESKRVLDRLPDIQ